MREYEYVGLYESLWVYGGLCVSMGIYGCLWAFTEKYENVSECDNRYMSVCGYLWMPTNVCRYFMGAWILLGTKVNNMASRAEGLVCL